MSKRLTPWFSGEVRPVHEGWYEVGKKHARHGFYKLHWDGILWSISPSSLARWPLTPSHKWRGIMRRVF